jgi:hypothetical protein
VRQEEAEDAERGDLGGEGEGGEDWLRQGQHKDDYKDIEADMEEGMELDPHGEALQEAPTDSIPVSDRSGSQWVSVGDEATLDLPMPPPTLQPDPPREFFNPISSPYQPLPSPRLGLLPHPSAFLSAHIPLSSLPYGYSIVAPSPMVYASSNSRPPLGPQPSPNHDSASVPTPLGTARQDWWKGDGWRHPRPSLVDAK